MRLYLVPNKQMLPKEWSEAYENISCGELSHISSESVTPDAIFRGANILQSFKYCDRFTEEIIIPNCKSFLLDSGAFTFFTVDRLTERELQEYVERYIDFIKRNKIERFFELDIDSVIGLQKVERIRNGIEKAVGRQSIPVWHKERGWRYFERMCDEYDYVSIGGVAKNPNGKKIESVFPQFIKCAHERGAKIHGLGYTSLKGLHKYHFDSVDSSTWSAGNRFGHVFTFDGKTLVQRKRNPGERIADHQALSLHNFLEWCKFADYAEKKL